MLRLKADLHSGKTALQYGDRSYTVEEVKTDLAHRFDRYKTNEATLASLKQIRQARQKSVVGGPAEAGRHVGGQAAVAGRGREPRCPYADGRCGPNHQQLPVRREPTGAGQGIGSNLKTRLEVAEKLVNTESTFQDEIPVDKPASANIVQQVSEYFSDPAPDAKAVAKK